MTYGSYSTTFSQQFGSSNEPIQVKIEYGTDFNNDGFNDIKVTLSLDPAANSGTEDMLGVAFDINDNLSSQSSILNDLHIVDIQRSEDSSTQTLSTFNPTVVIGANQISDSRGYLDPGFNTNGSGSQEPYDIGIKFSDQGLSEGIVQNVSFVITKPGEDLDKSLLENTDWWVRLQSTDGGGSSAKTGGRINTIPDGSTANPAIDVEKYVSVDGGNTWLDADTATGPLAVPSQKPLFKFVVQNTGNVALSNITLSDDKFDLNGTAPGTSIPIASLAANDGATGGADEYSFTFTRASWQAGQHTDIATVSTTYTDDAGNTANLTDSDAANYYGVSGPGVGTPGFWKNWTAIWDGDTRNDRTFNTKTNFAKADILYSVVDPVTGMATTPTNATASTNRGILIGDFNRDGLTNPGENTIYYSVAEAQAILNSSVSNDNQDARYIIGKQLIASWLNVLAGNEYAHIQTDINNAVAWMQNATPNEGGTSTGDGSLTAAGSTKLPSSNARWSTSLGSVSGTHQHYGSQIKDVLDEYNNTGAGYAIDRDTGLVGGSADLLNSLQLYQPYF